MSMGFYRQQVGTKKRIPKNWRKPKGRHSKLRERRHGLHMMPRIGFKKTDRMPEKLVYNINEINSLKKGDKIKLGANIGAKKLIAIIDLCMKKGIIIINCKKPSDKLKKLNDDFGARKENRDKRLKIKTARKEEARKKEEKKKEEEAKKKVVVKKEEKTNVPEDLSAKKKAVVKKEDDKQ